MRAPFGKGKSGDCLAFGPKIGLLEQAASLEMKGLRGEPLRERPIAKSIG